MNDTRIRRDNRRDAEALARLYAEEDSDRGYLARQLLRYVGCVCGETSARNCPVHAPLDEAETTDLVVLGRCIHGVDLDREFCSQGCRV